MIAVVIADKGGVAKTTLTLNVGCEAARQGARVLLIDADSQADLTISLGVPRQPGTGLDRLLTEYPTPALAECARPTVVTVAGSGRRWGRPDEPQTATLDLVGSHHALRRVDRVLAKRHRREWVLDAALAPHRARYDLILIDLGHSEAVQRNAIACADFLIVPTTSARLDADHVFPTLEEVEAVRTDLGLASLVTPARMLVSITRNSMNSTAEDEWSADLQREYKPVLATLADGSPAIVPFTPRAIEASGRAMSLRTYYETHGTRRDGVLMAAVTAYAAITERVLARAADLATGVPARGVPVPRRRPAVAGVA